MAPPDSPLGTREPAPPDFLAGPGEVRALMRAVDWTRTPLGPIESWPQSLRAIVRVMLTSRFAMWMAWGPELTFLCNDAYLPTVGLKRDWVIGSRSDLVWAEIWPDIGPRIARVLESGEATWDEALRLYLERSGFPEETFHTFSYSPLADDDGAVRGMLCVVAEVTERTIGERQLAMLRDLGARFASASARAEVFDALEHCLAATPNDLPFALAYFVEDHGTTARLTACHGVAAPSPFAPKQLTLNDPTAVWSLGSGAVGAPIRVPPALLDGFRPHHWQIPPHEAVILQIGGADSGAAEETTAAGYLIAGLNPHRRLDTNYRGFLELMVAQIAAAIARADQYERERERLLALAEIDRAKTVFFSNVSHELRTPLTLLRGPIEDLLAEEPLGTPDGKRDLLALAHRNALRLQKLVDTLLDFSRIEAGRMQASFAPVDIVALTRDLASTFRSATERAGLELTIHADQIDAPVHLDADMWEKIVLNLLSNAFKFTFKGGIDLAIRHVPEGVEVSVRDSGVGIPAEALPHLFERFYRSSDSRARSIEGTGIGLALVRELVEIHGGTIRVESVVDRGSTFTIRLPLGTAHLPAEQIHAAPEATRVGSKAEQFVTEALKWLPGESAPSPQTPPSLQMPLPASGGRILLADDNGDMRAYVARRLRECGFDVEEVGDGEAALAALRQQRPELVLSDVMMPKLDGFALLRAIRGSADSADLPVILLSARAGEEARLEAMSAGADDYLVKPFHARELVARVDTSIRLARLRRGIEAGLRQQKEILEKIAAGAPLDEVLERIVAFVEAEEPGAVAMIMPLGPDGRTLTRSYGRSLPQAFHLAFLGGDIDAPFGGACAEAMAHRAPIMIADVAASEDYTTEWRQTILRQQLRALRSTPILDADGRPLGALALAWREPRDPTPADPSLLDVATHLAAIALGRQRAQRRLADTAARLKRAQQAGQISDWTWDIADDTITTSGPTDAVFGIALADMPKTGTSFFSHVEEPERGQLLENLSRAFNAGTERFDVEFPFTTPRRERRWIAARAEVVAHDAAGRPSRIVGINFDVTRRRRTETELRELTTTLEERIAVGLAERKLLADLVEGTDALILVLQADYRILAFNKALTAYVERVYKTTPRLGQTLSELLADNPQIFETARRVWDRALAGEEFTILNEYPDPDRDKIWFEAKFNTLRDASGNIIGAYHFVYDVTERVQAERRLAEAEAQLHEAQKLETIGQLTGGIAHDFNNLLTPIVVGLDLLWRRYGQDERAVRVISSALQAAERARGLVARLLSFARRQALEARPVVIPDLIEGMSELIDRSLGPQIKVELRLPTEMPLALVDPNQLELALLNLCVNARDAMPGGGTLTISSDVVEIATRRALLRPGRYVRISVADSGVGMDAGTLRRAAEPFFTTKGVGKGTGLGLSMVHGLAAQSGGGLELESTPGVGTIAHIHLPVASQPAPQQIAPPDVAATAGGARYRILLVDDEELVRVGLRDILEDLGHSVVDVASATAALHQIQLGIGVDLVLTDYMMPGMTGVALIREVRRIFPKMPALLITGYASLDAADAEALHRVSKPIRAHELAAAITAAIRDGVPPNLRQVWPPRN